MLILFNSNVFDQRRCFWPGVWSVKVIFTKKKLSPHRCADVNKIETSLCGTTLHLKHYGGCHHVIKLRPSHRPHPQIKKKKEIMRTLTLNMNWRCRWMMFAKVKISGDTDFHHLISNRSDTETSRLSENIRGRETGRTFYFWLHCFLKTQKSDKLCAPAPHCKILALTQNSQ